MLILGSDYANVAQAKAPPRQYVLKHLSHERCHTHYTKKIEWVNKREHGHIEKVRATFCVYTAPAATAPSAPVTIEPLATTTTLSVSLVDETPTDSADCSKDHFGECWYQVIDATVNRFGESPPGCFPVGSSGLIYCPAGAGPVLQFSVPPSQELHSLELPSGGIIHAYSHQEIKCHSGPNYEEPVQCERDGCRITLGLPADEPAEYECEPADPRVVLTASYLSPPKNWLASQSEPQTIY